MANFGGIDIAIITAVIALISSAFASIMTYIFNRKLKEANNKYQKGLKELKNQLATKKSEQDARRNYEYEARKHLYEVCKPLLFQIVELSGDALQRIIDLAFSAKLGYLEPNAGWLSGVSYYMVSTVYRLLSPMAAFKLLQRKLTLVDLALDSSSYSICLPRLFMNPFLETLI